MRAHDSWLAAKQAERRLDEARSEASILRKKLTSLTIETSGSKFKDMLLCTQMNNRKTLFYH